MKLFINKKIIKLFLKIINKTDAKIEPTT